MRWELAISLAARLFALVARIWRAKECEKTPARPADDTDDKNGEGS